MKEGINNEVTINEDTYHIAPKLAGHWDKVSLEKIKKRNSDRVYIVDGRERSGKSTWAIQQMGYLDPEAFETPEKFLSRICFTADQFNDAVRNTKNGVVIFDEAFRGMSSRAALSKVNKLIIQTLMEMGQNNNIVFLVLPSIFRLDMYAAVERSDGLIHISEIKKKERVMRKWQWWNRNDKNTIYQIGIKKGWGYTKKTRFNGSFGGKFPGGKEFRKAYDKKKYDTFVGNEEKDIWKLYEKSPEFKRDKTYFNLYQSGKSYGQIAEFTGESKCVVHRAVHKYADYVDNTEKPSILRSKGNTITQIRKINPLPPKDEDNDEENSEMIEEIEEEEIPINE